MRSKPLLAAKVGQKRPRILNRHIVNNIFHERHALSWTDRSIEMRIET